jgi:hypothetical protein
MRPSVDACNAVDRMAQELPPASLKPGKLSAVSGPGRSDRSVAKASLRRGRQAIRVGGQFLLRAASAAGVGRQRAQAQPLGEGYLGLILAGCVNR